MQIIASELANGHVKDDENKSRTDFLLPVSCFCYFEGFGITESTIIANFEHISHQV